MLVEYIRVFLNPVGVHTPVNWAIYNSTCVKSSLVVASWYEASGFGANIAPGAADWRAATWLK